MTSTFLKQFAFLACVSLVVALILFTLDLWVFSSNPYVAPADAAFFEGLLLVLSGILLFIGSGGISRASQKAAMLASTAKAISAGEVIGPSEIFRRDTWKPRGYMRVGLVLIFTGLILLATYFAALNIH